MKESKPIPLWKSLVGISISSFVIFACIALLVIRSFFDITPMEMVLYPILLAFGVLYLIFNILLLRATFRYLRAIRLEQAKALSEEKARSLNEDSKSKEEKTELLHRLLSEGKITIEEYDRLKGE